MIVSLTGIFLSGDVDELHSVQLILPYYVYVCWFSAGVSKVQPASITNPGLYREPEVLITLEMKFASNSKLQYVDVTS